jgi:hypothetical protein
MLSRDVMGALALAILWVNTLLIAAAAWKRRSALVRRTSSLSAIRGGTVLRGDGPGGALAALEVTQVGRLTAAALPTIAFHDQAYASLLCGGRLALTDGSEVDVAASECAEVWVDDSTFRDAATCPSLGAFEAARADARKARGFARTVSAPIGSGRAVFVATAEDGILVATFDPRVWLARKTTLASLFVALELLVAGACTAACLHPPVFGTLSTVGGAASLAFFLLVQPAGTWVRDALRTPDRALRRGTWTRPGGTELAR